MSKLAIRLRALAALVGTGLLVGALVWKDRDSLERGNRLLHEGDTASAVLLYRAHTESATPSAEAYYNLGTVLIPTEGEEAQRHLHLAIEGEDPTARQRAYYNLGQLLLTSALGSFETGAAAAMLAESAANNRAALRLDPEDEDAWWNLFFAEWMLASLTPASEDGVGEDAVEGENAVARDERQMSDSVGATAKPKSEGAEQADDQSSPESDDSPGSDSGSGPKPEGNGSADADAKQEPSDVQDRSNRPPIMGAREAVAGQDGGPVTRGEAMLALDNIQDDARQLIQALLWSHRPDVAWWQSQPFPGGNW